MTLNWTAMMVAGAGAVVGGLLGAVAAAARNRPPGDSALIGAALGAIVGSVATPSTHGAP